MKLEYVNFHEMPESEILNEIIKLHTKVFGESDSLMDRMQEKRGLYINIALDGQQVVGYKIGYAENREQFYSWLGGVDENYRNHGIAGKLMENQHNFLIEKGYKVVRTHTKNKWRSMLVLNIKNGFDVIGTYTDKVGEPKIILEKEL